MYSSNVYSRQHSLSSYPRASIWYLRWTLLEATSIRAARCSYAASMFRRVHVLVSRRNNWQQQPTDSIWDRHRQIYRRVRLFHITWANGNSAWYSFISCVWASVHPSINRQLFFFVTCACFLSSYMLDVRTRDGLSTSAHIMREKCAPVSLRLFFLRIYSKITFENLWLDARIRSKETTKAFETNQLTCQSQTLIEITQSRWTQRMLNCNILLFRLENHSETAKIVIHANAAVWVRWCL